MTIRVIEARAKGTSSHLSYIGSKVIDSKHLKEAYFSPENEIVYHDGPNNVNIAVGSLRLDSSEDISVFVVGVLELYPSIVDVFWVDPEDTIIIKTKHSDVHFYTPEAIIEMVKALEVFVEEDVSEVATPEPIISQLSNYNKRVYGRVELISSIKIEIENLYNSISKPNTVDYGSAVFVYSNSLAICEYLHHKEMSDMGRYTVSGGTNESLVDSVIHLLEGNPEIKSLHVVVYVEDCLFYPLNKAVIEELESKTNIPISICMVLKTDAEKSYDDTPVQAGDFAYVRDEDMNYAVYREVYRVREDGGITVIMNDGQLWDYNLYSKNPPTIGRIAESGKFDIRDDLKVLNSSK